MDYGIGIAEASAEGVADLDVGHLGAVDRIEHHEPVGDHGALADGGADPEGGEGGEGVWAELQPGADLAECGGL